MEKSLLDLFKDLAGEHGLVRALLAVLIIWFVWHATRTADKRVKDHKEQIDLLAKENHDYRERFLSILDKKFGFEKQ